MAESLGPRVGYVIKRFPRLSETFILNELRALRALGTDVEVFSLKAPEPDQQQALLAELDVEAHYLPDKGVVDALPVTRRNYGRGRVADGDLRHALRGVEPPPAPPFPGKRHAQCATLQVQSAVLAALARARGIGHLHAHFASDAATVAMLAARLAEVPFSITAHAKDIYHDYDDAEAHRAFLVRKLREAAFTVTVSDYNKAYLQGLAGSEARIERLYNGVDLARLQVHHQPREERLVVAVGRLVEKKGFGHLVAACHRLRRRGVDFRCVLIGEGPERARLEGMIERWELGEQVALLGALPQEAVFDWLRRATLFTLPCVVSASGDRDGLPTVILECMALGTPVVATEVAGLPEMIEDGVSGRLVPPRDEAALADALQHLLEAPATHRRRLAEAARRTAEARFDLMHNVARLQALFRGSVRGMEALREVG